MNESLVDQTLEEYFEDPDFETIIVKDEGLASSSHERPETNKKKQGNDRDVLEINKGNLSVAKKLKVVYPCEICHDIFRSTISLEQHLFYQHSETDCKNCQKSFSDLKKLRVHSNKCSAIKSLQLMCSYCGDGFQYEKTLEEHVVRRHEQEKKVPCGICGKFFADGKDMKNHLFREFHLRFFL